MAQFILLDDIGGEGVKRLCCALLAGLMALLLLTQAAQAGDLPETIRDRKNAEIVCCTVQSVQEEEMTVRIDRSARGKAEPGQELLLTRIELCRELDGQGRLIRQRPEAGDRLVLTLDASVQPPVLLEEPLCAYILEETEDKIVLATCGIAMLERFSEYLNAGAYGSVHPVPVPTQTKTPEAPPATSAAAQNTAARSKPPGLWAALAIVAALALLPVVLHKRR